MSNYSIFGFKVPLKGVSRAEVHKVPEPARKYLKISLLTENVDQNPRVENTDTFVSFSQKVCWTQYSCRTFSSEIGLTEKCLPTI